jgi:hypothetical protein
MVPVPMVGTDAANQITITVTIPTGTYLLRHAARQLKSWLI